MPVARLIPSSYGSSGTNYISVTNADNMYTNVDSTTYATIQNTNASTSSRYLYLRGFNLSTIPNNAIINSITVKIKGYESGLAVGSNYYPRLCNNTTAISGTTASETFGTSTKTITIPTGNLDWDDIKGYGSNFGILVYVRRNARNTVGYFYCYGAEIEVNYTIPVYYAVTIQNSTSAIVTASDTNPLEGKNVEIFTNTLSGLIIKDNGIDVTNQFVKAEDDTISAVPGSSFTTGFSQSSANFYQSSSTTGTSWLEYAIGHSAESPYSTSNTSNTYVKPEGATGWINYEFDFSEIPSSATIQDVSVKVYGAREDATVDTSHVARFQCYSGNTAKGTLQNFTSTSNGIVTITDPGTWTATELHDAQLRFEVGYYGGRMLGITWSVTYEVDGYVYTIIAVNADHTIVVTSGGVTETIYFKNNGTWVSAANVYKKVNGAWIRQSNLSSVFDTNTNYVKG